jgi:hypothetical protein
MTNRSGFLTWRGSRLGNGITHQKLCKNATEKRSPKGLLSGFFTPPSNFSFSVIPAKAEIQQAIEKKRYPLTQVRRIEPVYLTWRGKAD